MSKVMVFGSFDLLHNEYEEFFRKAKQHGTELVVVVARDLTVESVKGHPPVHTEEERLKHVSGAKHVDKALLGSLQNKYDLIAQEQPDVICLEYDQTSFVDGLLPALHEYNLHPLIIRLPPYKEKQ